MMDDLRSRFIRETEDVIDKLRKKMDLLVEEAGQIEDHINEYRQMLRLLKSGVIPEEGNITNGQSETPERVVVQGAGAKKRKPRVDIEEETFLEVARKLTHAAGGKGITSQELAKALGQHDSAARRRLQSLEKVGKAKMITEASRVGRQGRLGARWRVS
jgi:response regulator of citrate/malate metabolism